MWMGQGVCREWGGATGLFSVAEEGGCDTSLTAACSSGMQTTLDLEHLCLQVVLQDLNLCPHAMYCHSQGGSSTAFAASYSCSCLAA